VLGFCVDVQHAKDLAEEFNANGIATKAVYGAMDREERKQVLKDFSEGKYRVLTNCQLLTEGFDEPSIDCIIMGRPTKSTPLFTQMVGRGTRIYPNKKNCLILDMVDVSSRHDLCTCKNTLEGAFVEVDGKKKKIQEDDPSRVKKAAKSSTPDLNVELDRVEEFEFFAASHFAWTQVGESWHLSLGSQRDVWVRQGKGGFLVVAQIDGELINLSNRELPLDYAIGLAEDFSRKQTVTSAWARKDAPWRTEPATTKQLETLEKLGIKFNYGVSKGDAARLLDQKINEPATPKQIYWLRTRRVKFEPNISKMQAKRLIAGQKGGF
jgi:hypothetical protein